MQQHSIGMCCELKGFVVTTQPAHKLLFLSLLNTVENFLSATTKLLLWYSYNVWSVICAAFTTLKIISLWDIELLLIVDKTEAYTYACIAFCFALLADYF